MVFNQQKKYRETAVNLIDLHGKEVEIVDEYKHIGIKRTTNSQGQGHIDEAIITGRKTTYALMGVGLHGYNGVNPKIGLQIWNTYVKPRVIYGLENVKLTNGDRKKLNQYHKRCLKQMLQLPERTADEGVYIIAGEMPLEAEIDRKILTQLMQIFRGNDIEREIAERQLAVKDPTSNSWFIYAGNIQKKYELPKIHDLLNNPVSKEIWKNQVTDRIKNFWKNNIIEKAKTKSSLRYLDLENFEIGTIHNAWEYCNEDTLAVSKAGVKVRLLTGTYLLQSHVAKFQQRTESPTCILCKHSDETIEHFVIQCAALEAIRKPFMEKLRKIFVEQNLLNHLLVNKDLLLLSVLNPGHSRIPLRLQEIRTIHDLETIGRGMCHALHRARMNQIESKNSPSSPCVNK